MPWAGGVFSLLPVSHAEPGTQIRAEQQNAPHEDFAAGLNNCLTRDGSTTMLANLPMNGRKVVNLAAGTNPADAVRMDQLPASSAWLESVAALTMAADRFPYATGPEAAALATLTAFARTLLDDADAPTARATLGLTIATAALAVLNAAADHNTAAWQAGTATTPGFPTPAQLRAVLNSFMNVGGAAPVFACRAWVNFNGVTGSIRSAGNVSSVTKNGNGDYTVNFTTAMPDANYAVLMSSKGQDNDTIGSSNNPRPTAYSGATASSVRIFGASLSAVPVDAENISVAIFR